MRNISFATGSLGRDDLIEINLHRALKKVEPESLFAYGDPLGLPALRERIAKLRSVSPENVLVTSSTQQALGIVMSFLSKHGSVKVKVMQPAYFGVYRLLKAHEMVAVPFWPSDDLPAQMYQTTSPHGEFHPAIVYLTSNFHSPTGLSLPDAAKQAIASSGAWIVEDNPYDDLFFTKKPSTIRELAPERTFYLGGFSKIVAPGLRVGYVIAPTKAMRALKSLKIDQDIFTSTLSQEVCLHAIEDEYLDSLRTRYREMRDMALESLFFNLNESQTAPTWRWSMPEGGIFLRLVLFGVNIADVSRLAAEKGLTLEDERHTYWNGQGGNTTRLNFVLNDKAKLREGLHRLREATKEARKCAS